MLAKIEKLWKDLEHYSWFNDQKNIYVMNNIVILDHHGLLIYSNTNYLKSYPT
jgi:hypothetical protein